MRRAVLVLSLVGCTLDRSGLSELTSFGDAARDTALSSDSTVAADTSIADVPLDTDVVDTALRDTAVVDTAPEVPPLKDPIILECESFELFGGMVTASDARASLGKWASVPEGATPWDLGVGTPPIRVELSVNLPAAGEWYVFVDMYTRAGDADAMYVGFEGGPLRRFFSTDWLAFKWVSAEGSGARLQFNRPAGVNKLFVGAGEKGTGCDRVALTQNAAWTPP